tara:strand:- start:654 stop:1424 length:771 start_codon:yes stop_codon:yes gene_type:complete
MYELRLKNFIIFRNAKLYDEIVPQMQEHYCDFHGFSLDLKRPLDEKLCEHMFSFLNIKEDVNIVLVGLPDLSLPAKRKISFDWLLFNDLVKPDRIAMEQKFPKLDIDIAKFSTLCAWWFNYGKFKTVRYNSFEADNAINLLEKTDDPYFEKISFKSRVLFDCKLQDVFYTFESICANKKIMTSYNKKYPLVACRAETRKAVASQKRIGYCAGYIKNSSLYIHHCNVIKRYRGLGIEKTMEQVLFDWAEGEGAKTIL